jgi:hypothetical protein
VLSKVDNNDPTWVFPESKINALREHLTTAEKTLAKYAADIGMDNLQAFKACRHVICTAMCFGKQDLPMGVLVELGAAWHAAPS